MRDILFGMAVGSVLGILLYKNNTCVQESFDKGEKMIVKELNKMEQETNRNKSKKVSQ